jgi:hypothetical protein
MPPIFVDVSYRDHGFFIDDRDVLSKRTFYFLMLMMRQETANKTLCLKMIK